MAVRTSQTPRTDGAATRARIVAAAEALFAERGIDGVSLQEINRAAGQRNRSAVQYHLGSKEGVIHAILDKHTPGIAARRQALLDELDVRGRADLRELVGVLVRPAAEKLDDPDGGVAFLRVNAALIGHPEFALLDLHATRPNPSAARMQRAIAAACPHLPKAVWRSRWILLIGLIFHGLADYARLSGSGRRRRVPGRAVFVDSLIDSVVALLAAPAPAAPQPTRR